MKKVAVIMDPINLIDPARDTSLSMMEEMQRRKWQVFYVKPHSVIYRDNKVLAETMPITVKNSLTDWCSLGAQQTMCLSDMDLVLLRIDPPFNMEYIYLTYLVEQVERTGTIVWNKPQSVRDANEKVFAINFPNCTPDTLITSQTEQLQAFLEQHHECVCKPLDDMGGTSIFKLQKNDPNCQVIFETITKNQTQTIMMQRYIPEIKSGDKRVFLIHGEPYEHALVRIPKPGDFRGNLASGASYKFANLTKRDYWICQQVGSALCAKGLVFVGLDIIGDYLTEINVTSPTGARVLDSHYNENICARLFDRL